MLKTKTVLPAILLLAVMGVSSGHAASFDCESKELKPDEKTICDTRSLNDADVKMATTFDILSPLLAMGARGTMQEQQVKWLAERQACGADTACLEAAYDKRLKELDEAFKMINKPL